MEQVLPVLAAVLRDEEEVLGVEYIDVQHEEQVEEQEAQVQAQAQVAVRAAVLVQVQAEEQEAFLVDLEWIWEMRIWSADICWMADWSALIKFPL